MISDNVTEIIPALDKVVPDVVNGVVGEIESRALNAGTVIRDGLEELLNSCLEKAGLMALMQRIEGPPAQESQAATHNVSPAMTRAHMWGGKFHPVPQDFSFPDASTLIAWQYWVCGDREKELPLLRSLTPDDMSSKNMRKRLCDFKFLMQIMEEKVKEIGEWKDNITVQEANEMFAKCQQLVLVQDTVSEKMRKRRPEQIKWSTMVNLIRKKQKSQ